MLESYAPEDSVRGRPRRELTNVYWRLQRLHRVENRYWEQLGGSYNRADEGIAKALLQTPDRQMRNFFRYYAQVEHSYYKALAAANQIKREKRDPKPLKVIAAAAQNGFVSQTTSPTDQAATVRERDILELDPNRVQHPGSGSSRVREMPPPPSALQGDSA